MNTRWRTAMVVLAAASIGIGATARAEPTLRYNYDYVCNQERVVVGHCRHDSDTPDMPPTTPEDDFCQVYYPDRPKGGGIEAMGVVLRGDLIKSLEACGAFGATGATPGGNAKAGATSAAAGPAPPRPRAAEPPPQGPAEAPPGGRPQRTAMPIGPEMCPLLRRLETLAHEDFRSIDLGPDRRVGRSAELFHRTSIQMPPADCWISIDPKMPEAYNCLWPAGKEKEVDDQFVNLGRTLEQCMGGTLDLSMLEFGYVTVKVRGVEFVASIANDSVSLDVRMAKP